MNGHLSLGDNFSGILTCPCKQVLLRGLFQIYQYCGKGVGGGGSGSSFNTNLCMVGVTSNIEGLFEEKAQQIDGWWWGGGGGEPKYAPHIVISGIAGTKTRQYSISLVYHSLNKYQ